MKSLALKSFTECTNANASARKDQWLLQNYPNLQHIHWNPLKSIPPQLSTLIAQNANLKSVYATQHFLPFAQRHSIKLDELIIKLAEQSTESRIETFNQLKRMSTERAIQSLYFVEFHKIEPEYFGSLANVVGLSTLCDNVHDIVEMFPNLKMLSVQIRSKCLAVKMAQQLVHLEEAFVDVNHLDYIVPFIRFTKKLRTIFINNTDSIKALPNLNLSKLVKQRKKLANSTSVVIYLKEEAYLKIKCLSIRSYNPLIQIKSIASYVTSNAFVNIILNH